MVLRPKRTAEGAVNYQTCVPRRYYVRIACPQRREFIAARTTFAYGLYEAQILVSNHVPRVCGSR